MMPWPFEWIWFGPYVVAALTAPSVLMQRRGRPVAAVGWLLALFALPPFALIAWWIFGRTHLRRRQRLRRRASEEIARSLTRTRQLTVEPALEVAGERRGGRQVAPLIGDSLFPPTRGNRVELLPDTLSMHRAWRELIAGAEDHLHLLFFAWHDDRTGREFRDLLAGRAAQGVEVRVLCDAIGSHTLPATFFDPLRHAGGEVAFFMPIRIITPAPMLNFRNHRKLLVADGRRACTGGVNVTDEYLDWLDMGLSIAGPGVHQIQEAFIDDWYFTTGRELAEERYFPSFPAPEPEPGLEHDAVCETVASGPDQQFNATRESVFLAITRCKRRLWIATPYFVPDGALLITLRTAVYRGVDVRLYVPARSDSRMVRRASRTFYPTLLDSGVQVFEYAGMLHAKALLFDDDCLLVGSANLDNRSFRLNFEIGSFVTSARVAQDLARVFATIEAASRPIHREEVARHSYLGQLQDAVAHLLSPLL